jgi:hypothetical protein
MVRKTKSKPTPHQKLPTRPKPFPPQKPLHLQIQPSHPHPDNAVTNNAYLKINLNFANHPTTVSGTDMDID